MTRTKLMVLFPLLLLAMLSLAPAAKADFGFSSIRSRPVNEDGSLASQAGSHPFAYEVEIDFRQAEDGSVEGGAPRDITVQLPAGLIGNPQAVPRCSRQQFEGITPACPAETQIGVVRADTSFGQVALPLFNVAPIPGSAALLAGSAVQLNVFQVATVAPENRYRVQVTDSNIPTEAKSVTEVIWGTPAAQSHDVERTEKALRGEGSVASSAPLLPFLTLPTSCQEPMSFSVSADSVQSPGTFVEESVTTLDEGGNPALLIGCQAIPFSPTVSAAPTTTAAESPSGLDFELALPGKGLQNPAGISESEPEKTEVTLPAGLSVNPSAAAGIVGCTAAQYASASLLTRGCPEASKLGTLVARSPLLDESIEGAVYLAQPHENQFGSLLALYIVASAKERGVLVKQAGLVQADPTTGRLTATFGELPSLPYSSFELDLREGPRAPLVMPQACGEYQTIARLYPFSSPGSPTVKTAPFKVVSGAGGSTCVASEAQLPANPDFEAGTTVPVAGNYSSFVFRISRQDGERRFSALQASLPVGLLGKLRGVPYCPESGIQAAESRLQEGGGSLELASPSCPAASEVGVVNVSAGAGSQPFWVQGNAYLAGPYKGAPLSLEIITPAIAGPFDLGAVAVRAAISVDPLTAQIHVQSDPLPTILHGIPLDVRTVSLQVNRPDFMLNPTNCAAKTVSGSITTQSGGSTNLSSPFAVDGCRGLDFKPSLKLSLKGSTRRVGHPALRAMVTYPKKGVYANIASAQVNLPHSEFLDQGNLNKTCTKPVLLEGRCPKSSVYGKATAWTPLLDQPLRGNVYLVGGFGYRLPALVAELNGQIRVLLVGKVDTGKNKGIRTTFETVPDAPVEKFVLEMKGGRKYGLLENSESLCSQRLKAKGRFSAQNGKTTTLSPDISVRCSHAKGGRKSGATAR
jgi:hypothetical protein